MTVRTWKERLAENRLLRVFSTGVLTDPVVIDMFALAGGYDGFWLDAEHGGLEFKQMQVAALAARANGFDSFVRLAPTDYASVTRALETGAGGVMAAQIHSAAQAEEFVRWAKFAPRGARGLNTGARDADYTHLTAPQFAARANARHLTAIQIETAGALAECEAIAAIDGVDLLFIGPNDLSQALGCLGQYHDDQVWSAVARVADACRAHGKHWGAVPADPAWATRAISLGARLLTFGSDLRAVRLGIEALQAAYPMR
jgi:2-dehydro-3-deoxyglucarate aldolase/4-hydroxy-2-oxoheptanedioate aldolase